MELWQVVGMDPAGAEAMALCAAAALVLAMLVGGGFLIIGRANRRQVRDPSSGSEALGVLALWRLNRAMRRVSLAPRTNPNSAHGPGTTVHRQPIGGSTTTS